MNAEKRLALLGDLEKLNKREAENVPAVTTFLPLDSHRMALRPEIVVVRGGRGAGKSALFRLIDQVNSSVKLKDLFEDDKLPDAVWRDAYSQAAHHHPEVSSMDALAKSASDELLRAFWMAHLVRRLVGLGQGIEEIRAPVLEFWQESSELKQNVRRAEGRINQIVQALDAVDRILSHENRIVFAAYDHLDRIGGLTTEVRRRCVKALLAMWLSLSNRYRCLRAKIFLREDLFEAGERDFPDASKLRPRSIALEWDVESLYRVAVRHLASTSEDMRGWLEGVPGLELRNRGEWGWIPGPMPVKIQKEFADRLSGELMGRGAKKGYTYRWIPNRLQDAQVRIVPRSILCLLGFAGQEARKKPILRGTQLITPQNLMAALKQTSQERANEIREEYPLVSRLENLRRLQVPLEADGVMNKLGLKVQGEDAGLSSDGRLIFDELVRLGVLSLRPDGRVDVPDIYRYGFGILRKGGVATPK